MKINGNLSFDSVGEIQSLRVEKLAFGSVPVAAATDVGRLIFVTSAGNGYLANTLYQGVNVASVYSWKAVAGNVQDEVDAIEASLGAMVNADGTFNGAAFVSANSGIWPTAPTDLTNALDILSDYATGKDTLEEIEIPGPTGSVLYSTGTTWEQALPGATSGVQAYDVELDALSTVVSAADVLPYFTGTGTATGTTLTSLGRDIIDSASVLEAQTTLELVPGTNVQAYDAGLQALAAAGTGLVSMDGDTVAFREVVAPAAGITVSNANGVSGNITLALADDLAALEGLVTTGYIVRTATGAATTRAIAGVTGMIDVANGDGVASDTSLTLADVTLATGGTFQKFTVDAKGRVSATDAVVTADITALVDGTYVNVAGDTMEGALNMGGQRLTGLTGPTGDTDATTKAYVDSLTTGLSWKNAVRVATTEQGVLASSFPGGSSIDGVVLVNGDRILIKNQTNASENGIYIVTGGAPTRAADMNDALEFDGAAVYVQEGTVNESTGWTQTATVAAVGSDPVAFSQFSGANLYTWGTGLSSSGNTINVNLGAGIAELPSDEVGLDLHAVATSALILTTDGTARTTGANGALALLLSATGGLVQGVDGLAIPADGVTNAMLVNDAVVTDADTGTGSLALGGTLEVQGSSVQGIVTSVSGSVFTVSATDATTTAKGVASFDSGDFSVAAGVVSIAAGGVDNAQLANSSVTFTADVGSDVIALGQTLTISGDGVITTSTTAGTLDIAVALATTGSVGVAKFAAADFAVDGAAQVTLAPINLDKLSDVTISTAVAGDTLVKSAAGDFVNRQTYFLYTSGAAATSHTVTHNLGVKFANVTVVDSSDEVVIPQSIKFDTANQLTVTFTTAIDTKVVVMGVNAS